MIVDPCVVVAVEALVSCLVDGAMVTVVEVAVAEAAALVAADSGIAALDRLAERPDSLWSFGASLAAVVE